MGVELTDKRKNFSKLNKPVRNFQNYKIIMAAETIPKILPQTSITTKDDLTSKQSRAERFGLELSEKDKKKMRAEKYGLSSPTKTPKNNDKPDKETLKRRSERFGLDNEGENNKNENVRRVKRLRKRLWILKS